MRNWLLFAESDLIGDDRPLRVPNRFHVGNFEAAVLQRRLRSLQRAVQFALQLRHLFGRREDASVHFVNLPVTRLVEQFDLRGGSWYLARGLIVKPAARSEEYEDQNGDDGQVVLPRAAFVRPEKNSRKKLTRRCHFSPSELHPR